MYGSKLTSAVNPGLTGSPTSASAGSSFPPSAAPLQPPAQMPPAPPGYPTVDVERARASHLGNASQQQQQQQRSPPNRQYAQQQPLACIAPVDIKDENNQMQFDVNAVFFGSIDDFARGTDKFVIPGAFVQKKLLSTYGPLKTFDEVQGREVPINDKTPYVITRIDHLGSTQQSGAPHDLAFRIADVPSKGLIVPSGLNKNSPMGEFHGVFTHGNKTDTLFAMKDHQLDVVREWSSVASGAKLAREGKVTNDAFLTGCRWFEGDKANADSNNYPIYVPLNRDGYDVQNNPHPLLRVLTLPTMAEVMNPIIQSHNQYAATAVPSEDNLRTQNFIRVPASVVALAKSELQKTCIDNLKVRHLQDPIEIQIVRPDGHIMNDATNTQNAENLHSRNFRYTTQLRFTVALPRNQRTFVQ